MTRELTRWVSWLERQGAELWRWADAAFSSSRAVYAALAIAVVAIVLPFAPRYEPVMGFDEACHAYIAQYVIDGKAPYGDAWDHTFPGIFLIDAAGLLMGGRWGLWVLIVLFVFAAFAVMYVVLARELGRVPALFGVTLSLIVFRKTVPSGANMTEVFALVFQALGLWLFLHAERGATAGKSRGWHWSAVGCCAGYAFSLRPTLVATFVAVASAVVALRITQRRWRALVADGATMLAGCIVVLAGFASWFVLGGFWKEAIDALGQNRHFLAAPDRDTWGTLVWALRLTLPCSAVAVVGWVLAAIGALLRRAKPTPLLVWLLAAFPVELALSVVSGHPWDHYFVALVLVFGVAATHLPGLAGAFIPRLSSAAQPTRRLAHRWARAAGLLVLLLPASAYLARRVYVRETLLPVRDGETEIVDFIKGATAPGDPVLVWGGQIAINVAAHRAAPSRYIFLNPMLTIGYQSDAMVETFLRDLEGNPPRVIIESSTTDPVIPPLDALARSTWRAHPSYPPLPSMARVYEFVEQGYVEIPVSPRWRVLVMRGWWEHRRTG